MILTLAISTKIIIVKRRMKNWEWVDRKEVRGSVGKEKKIDGRGRGNEKRKCKMEA